MSHKNEHSHYSDFLPYVSSDEARRRIFKIMNMYYDTYHGKQIYEKSYNRHLDTFKSGDFDKVPFSEDDFLKAFKAKNFWRDLYDCGSWLEFRFYTEPKKVKLYTANFCKRDRLCPACAVRRAYKQQRKFLSILANETSLTNQDWYYIVIPIKHSKEEPFEVVFGRIRSLLKRISMAMRNGKKGRTTNIFSRFAGAMYSIETTYTRNGWNVHLNLLINANNGVPFPLNEVKNRRGQISYQNEDLRLFLLKHYDSQMHNVSRLSFTSSDEIRSHLVEVLKYSLKFSSLRPNHLIEFFVKTKGKRLFGTLGNLYGKGIEDVELEGDVSLDGSFVELIFRRSLEDGLYYDYVFERAKFVQTDKANA